MPLVVYEIRRPQGTITRSVDRRSLLRQVQQRLRTWMQSTGNANTRWPLVVGLTGADVTLANFAVDGSLGPRTLSMLKHRLDAAGQDALSARIEADIQQGSLSTNGVVALVRVAENEWDSPVRVDALGVIPMMGVTPSNAPAQPPPAAKQSNLARSAENANTETAPSLRQPSTWPWYAWAGVAAVAGLATVGIVLSTSPSKPTRRRRARSR